jgi:hypothetical protein
VRIAGFNFATLLHQFIMYLCILKIMKALSVILSFYVLVLTTVPCIDRPFDKDIHQSGQAGNAAHNHENDTDQCSPFCVCNCCGSQVLSIETILISSILPLNKEHVFWYASTFKSNLFHSIWQPPKIS